MGSKPRMFGLFSSGWTNAEGSEQEGMQASRTKYCLERKSALAGLQGWPREWEEQPNCYSLLGWDESEASCQVGCSWGSQSEWLSSDVLFVMGKG